ncbi:MAG: hypothetical protein HQ596_03470 [Candidatus Saganbacteria bacterium]|nr:hypothetical protein [Candidatus Saganbacteria bacterium]
MHHKLAGTSFLLSSSLEIAADQNQTYLEKILEGDWNITQYRERFNRIWVKTGGKILPAIVTQKDLRQLSEELAIEVADLTRLVLIPEDNQLTVTEERIPANALLNAEIRERNFAYFSGASNELPPPLLTDMAEDKTILLCETNEGEPIRLKVQNHTRRDYLPGTMALVQVVSRHEVTRTIFLPSAKPDGHVITVKLPEDLLSPSTAAEASGTDSLYKKLGPGDRSNTASRELREWAFENGPLIVVQISRTLLSPGYIQFVNVDGLPFRFSGLEKIYKLGIREVTITLQHQTVLGDPNCRTARLYDPRIDPEKHPAKWFAKFELDESQRAAREGDQIGYLQLKFAGGKS